MHCIGSEGAEGKEEVGRGRAGTLRKATCAGREPGTHAAHTYVPAQHAGGEGDGCQGGLVIGMTIQAGLCWMSPQEESGVTRQAGKSVSPVAQREELICSIRPA